MDKEDIQLYDRLEHDEREVKAIVETAHNNGIREGIEQGIELQLRLNIKNLSEYGMSDTQIADALKIDMRGAVAHS